MTATQEVSVQEKVQAFVMPKPARGASVVWYQSGQRGKDFEIAFVLGVSRNSIEVRLASGYAKETVRHADDPRLLLNEAQRENGAWDYTEADRAFASMQQLVEDLKERVALLEQSLLTRSTMKKTKLEDNPL